MQMRKNIFSGYRSAQYVNDKTESQAQKMKTKEA